MRPKKVKNQTKTKNQSKVSKRNSKKSQKKNSKKLVERQITIKQPLIFIGAIFFLLAVMILGVYLLGWNNLLVRTVAKVIPFPVATVGSFRWVSFDDYCERVEIVRRYHNLQGVISGLENYDLGSEIGQQYLAVAKKNLLDRMVKEEVIKIIAKKNNISISQEDIQAEIEKIADANGGRAKLAEEVERIYQISFKDFSEKIIENKIYQRKLYQLVFQRGELNRQGREITLDEWIIEQTKKFKIYILLRQYSWSIEDMKVYFLDEEMNRYEEFIIQKDY